MFYRLVQLFILSIMFSPTSYASSAHGYAVDYIQGEGDVKGLKVAYQFHLPSAESPLANTHIYLESSINIWQYGSKKRHQTNFVFALSPVLQYPVGYIKNVPLFIEAGIGFSLINDTSFAGKNVSTHYQFEDRLGIVAKASDFSIGLRYLHYSNAGFKRPNPGLDFISLSFSKRF